MIRSSVDNCPVPIEQQPLHEYEELKNSWFFGDSTLGSRGYLTRILWIWGWSWLIAGPVSASSFPVEKHIFHFILCGTAIASLVVVLVLIRLYLGWFYIKDRLYSATVLYEESGWYDGQIWHKPREIIDRDRLIVAYEIKPILGRLQMTFGVVAILYFTGILVWNLF